MEPEDEEVELEEELLEEELLEELVELDEELDELLELEDELLLDEELVLDEELEDEVVSPPPPPQPEIKPAKISGQNGASALIPKRKVSIFDAVFIMYQPTLTGVCY